MTEMYLTILLYLVIGLLLTEFTLSPLYSGLYKKTMSFYTYSCLVIGWLLFAILLVVFLIYGLYRHKDS